MEAWRIEQLHARLCRLLRLEQAGEVIEPVIGDGGHIRQIVGRCRCFLKELTRMPSYDFALIIAAGKMSHEEMLEATDARGEADCTNGTLCVHAEGMEIMFTRSARSLQPAISSA